jgi:hypothetical protein
MICQVIRKRVLKALDKERETRDRIMLQNLIPILSQLRQTVDKWIDGEFKDLEDEIAYVDSFAIRDRASERIDTSGIELSKIREDQLPKALKELDELIEHIKTTEIQNSRRG